MMSTFSITECRTVIGPGSLGKRTLGQSQVKGQARLISPWNATSSRKLRYSACRIPASAALYLVRAMTDTNQLLREYVETGSEPAFREIVSRYVDLVYSVALRRLGGHEHLARDVVQTVF